MAVPVSGMRQVGLLSPLQLVFLVPPFRLLFVYSLLCLVSAGFVDVQLNILVRGFPAHVHLASKAAAERGEQLEADESQ